MAHIFGIHRISAISNIVGKTKKRMEAEPGFLTKIKDNEDLTPKLSNSPRHHHEGFWGQAQT
ncbi:MAG: hypothetical protein AAB091_00370, partial [Elusimicrobiota bacterium]